MFKIKDSQAGKMTYLVKVLATKPDNVSWVPRTHMIEGEGRFLGAVL